MYLRSRDACPGCGSYEARERSGAWISPWIRELANIRERCTEYRVCQECRTGYFTFGPSPDELKALYRDYRGPRYLAARSKWEPAYTKDLNAQLEGSEAFFASRIAALEKLVISVAPGLPGTARGVVDIGGGRGRLIPQWPCLTERVVLDVSGVVPVNGVKAIGSWAEVNVNQVDFVMLCGVLEHVPSPKLLLGETVDRLRVAGSSAYIFIEVPAGIPLARGKLLSRLPGFQQLNRHQRMWHRIDRLERGPNPIRRQIPLRMGEHLNFFTMQGMRALAESCGIKIEAIEEIDVVGLKGEVTVRFSRAMQLVGRLHTSQTSSH